MLDKRSDPFPGCDLVSGVVCGDLVIPFLGSVFHWSEDDFAIGEMKKKMTKKQKKESKQKMKQVEKKEEEFTWLLSQSL